MNEKPNFNDPREMPKRPNPDLEAYQSKVYESNPGAMDKKNELADLLEGDPFDEDHFREVADAFNKEMENTKGFKPQYTTIETIRGKHGQLNVYHFRGSNSVKFGYGHFK